VFAFVRELTGSPRTGAIAAVIYGTAPHQPYFNTLFVYGALALPFLVLSIWAAVRSRRSGTTALAVLPPFLIVMVAHHVSVAVTLVLLGICVVALALARVPWFRTIRLLMVTIVAACAAITWTLTRAEETFSYLGGPLHTIIASVWSGDGASPATRQYKPLWESVTSMAAAGLILLLIGIGIVALWRAKTSKIVRILSVLGGAYAVVMAIRVFTPDGPEFAGRLLTYVMLLAALPAAAALVWIWQHGRARLGVFAAITALSLLAAGSITSGLPPWWERVPRGFRIAADESGVDRSVLAAGQWAGQETRPNSRVACDLSICSVVASYGRATASNDASEVYYASSQELQPKLAWLSLDYVYVDRRMTEQVPLSGFYFWQDVRTGQHNVTLDAKLLNKFDITPGVDRVYDNGFVQAYFTRRAWS
jgi:hypothetical protein